jgi:hypothetical protein
MDKDKVLAALEESFHRHFGAASWPAGVHNALQDFRADMVSRLDAVFAKELVEPVASAIEAVVKEEAK